MAAKIWIRNNISQKLYGTSSTASVLRSSTLGLFDSAAEYCAPVWLNGAHPKKIDVELNRAMQIISGTLKPTPKFRLPTLRQEYLRIPIHEHSDGIQNNWLHSRIPTYEKTRQLVEAKILLHPVRERLLRGTLTVRSRNLSCVRSVLPGMVWHQQNKNTTWKMRRLPF